MFKVILFDLDNTLVDFLKWKRKASEAAVSAMIDAGLKIDYDKGVKKLFQMYDKYGYEDQNIFDKFLKQVQGKIDYKILASGVFAYRRTKTGHLDPYPDAVKTLISLKEKGLKLGIVSDAPRKQAWLRLVELRFADFFDFVVALEDTGKLKPHKMPFEKAIKLSKTKPEEILFVGDNPKRDIKGAKDVGMKTALAKYGQFNKSKGIKADYELKNLNGLIKIV